MQKLIHALSIIFLAFSAVILIALQVKTFGWIILAVGLLITLFSSKQFRKDISLIYLSLGFLGIAPISTDVGAQHFFIMGLLLFLAVFVPYFVTRFFYKNHLIRFNFDHERNWYKKD